MCATETNSTVTVLVKYHSSPPSLLKRQHHTCVTGSSQNKIILNVYLFGTGSSQGFEHDLLNRVTAQTMSYEEALG